MELLKKSTIVGVSVTPGIGLEVAQIDFAAKKVLKYGAKPLEYNAGAMQVADLDIFKETLQDLLIELDIPKTAKLVLNLPTVMFKINDFPAALDEFQVSSAIEEELLSNPFFEQYEPSYSYTKLPSASMQFNKVAYSVAQQSVLIEMVTAIKDLGYSVYAIDTSLNNTFNALVYVERLSHVQPDTNWILLLVDNCSVRVVSMIGTNFIDAYEEKISIGEVLDDTENYATVLSAAQPILKNIPAKYLYIVSETNVISAEILASKVKYNAPIIHQEANVFSKETLLEVAPGVDEGLANNISLCVIGAAIKRDFEPYANCNLNLFNEMLGEIYLMEQPPIIKFGGKKYVLSNEALLQAFIIIAIIVLVVAFGLFVFYLTQLNSQKAELEKVESSIRTVDAYLAANADISSETFDEGFEVTTGLTHNKAIYSYYTIVGTEIPKKLWLTHLKLSDKVTIEGQADNLESVYSFFRNIKDYDTKSDIKLQKLGLASKTSSIANDEGFDADSILTSANADFYEFRISNEPEVMPKKDDDKDNGGNNMDLPEIPANGVN